jgi:hypothetical protein
MKVRIGALFTVILLFASAILAQDIDPATRNARWKLFSKFGFDKVDFAKTKLTKTTLNRLKVADGIDDYALLRGVVFGKRGRVFKERSIQEYLEKQPWYKPNNSFSNSMLTPTERANLDIIRLNEAAKHEWIEPGDMRIWQAKLITDDNLRTYSNAEITILATEIEAIHGKPFSEEWLQKYFDERYWYKQNPAYDASKLTSIERKNLEKLLAERDKGRKTAIAIGDMDKFQNVALTEDKLAGLSILELRILREEFYARHGKKFEEPGIRDYFNWRDWYRVGPDQKAIALSRIEQQNVELLAVFEARQREKLTTEAIAEGTLGDLFAEDLKVLRNEIYARHGRIFKDQQLQKYFESQAWYKANPDFKDDQLSEIESANLKKIKEAEDSATSKFTAAEG